MLVVSRLKEFGELGKTDYLKLEDIGIFIKRKWEDVNLFLLKMIKIFFVTL